MRNAVILAALASASPALASSASTAVDGQVVAVDSRWTDSGDRIVTTTTLRREDGSEIELLQLGGTVDGIGMTVSHMPAVPRVGERVRATYSSATTLAGDVVRRVESMNAAYLPLAGPGAPQAPGYVNTRTKETGAPLHWRSSCVYVAYHAAGTSHIDDEFTIMDEVFETWRSTTQSCSYLTFELEGQVDVERVRYDGTNLILFREDRWCRPADGATPEMCYAPAAAALTTLFFVDDADSSRDGEIVDADIEMNAVHFAISDDGITNAETDCMADLRNTLTHEAGHLFGLDHTCWTGEDPRPIDHNGNEVPSCTSNLPEELTEATMYNFQLCGETKKATPEPDDIAATCNLYPLPEAPSVCERADIEGPGGWCQVGRRTSRDDTTSWPLWAAIALLALRGRRNSRACRAA